MYINQTVAKEIYNEAGEERLKKAKEYVKQRKVDVQNIYYENMNNFTFNSIVNGKAGKYKVSLSVKNGELENCSCECEDYHVHYAACKHIVATLLEIDGNVKYNEMMYTGKKIEKHTEFKDLINTFYEGEMNEIENEPQKIQIAKLDTNIKIIPKLILDEYSKNLSVEFPTVPE